MSDLMSLMRPRSVAIIGASNTPGKIGYAVVDNMKSSGFKGHIYPINPKEDEIGGLKAYPSITDVGKPIDVAAVSYTHLLGYLKHSEIQEFKDST